MKYAVCASAALALCVGAGASFAAEHQGHMAIPADVKAAVDNPDRPESDRKRDVNRKPAEALAFAGVKPGDKVAELIPGTGYYTRLLCKIVGDGGHVYQVNFKMMMAMPARPASAAARPPAPPPAPLGCDNVTAEPRMAASELMLPSDLDLVWTSENYHDLHDPFFGKPDMMGFDMTVFNALKPGGVFIIEDHVAAADSGARDTNTLHRIDPELVKKEVEAVGFRFVGESHVLHNPADDHTQRVFTMVDKTDRFVFKFRKPAA